MGSWESADVNAVGTLPNDNPFGLPDGKIKHCVVLTSKTATDNTGDSDAGGYVCPRGRSKACSWNLQGEASKVGLGIDPRFSQVGSSTSTLGGLRR